MSKQQERVYSCGPAALRNALRHRWQHKVREGVIRKLAGTTPDGTDELGLKAAANALGYRVVELWSDSRTVFYDWVKGSLLSGKPVLLCLQNWEHWCCGLGVIGDQIVVHDPSRFKKNLAEQGLHTMSKSRFMYQAWNGRKSVEDSRRAYALALYK